MRNFKVRNAAYSFENIFATYTRLYELTFASAVKWFVFYGRINFRKSITYLDSIIVL